MKKLIIFIAVFIFADVSDTVFKIKEIETSKKVFLPVPSYNIFTNTKTPNVSVNKIIPKKLNNSVDFKIYAIFNNKVNINGVWKSVGDFVNEYKIIKITPKYVVLKKDNEIKILKFTINFIKVSK